MNINDYKSEGYEGCKFKAIMDKQVKLMIKYHDIEERSGLMQVDTWPVNLDDRFGQARIKDFAWRLTEEIGEAIDALHDNDDVHYTEELIDGLHFLMELTVLSGTTYVEFLEKYGPTTQNQDIIDKLYNACCEDEREDINMGVSGILVEVIKELGMMCNCLKNKPWKQTFQKTDVNEFKNRLFKVWQWYIYMLGMSLSLEGIAEVYSKKSQVNEFRQRSNY